ncbi:hypothetical protein [Aureivirga sp. CE67]|uniref:hypothetical protein n=1 Tax=Aureivirga sp. CE67 TaxID=1788983 RepID=UPI0018CA30C5|nr:hypothetical protein [Aureivirga sp. CE67]
MRKILQLGLLILIGVALISSTLKEDYFEGEIHYDIDYKLQTDRTTIESLKLSTGSKMVMLFKDGNYYKKIYNSKNELIVEIMLLLENKKYYWKRYDSDTINWFDITKNDSPTVFKISGNKTFLNQYCTIVDSETKINYNNINKVLKARYVYSNELKTNPNWYDEYKEGNYNEISKKLNCIILEEKFDAYYYEKILRATSIISRKIKDKEFGFDIKNKPLKQI